MSLPTGLAIIGWPDGPGEVLREVHDGEMPDWLRGCCWSFPGAEGGPQWRAEPDVVDGESVLDLGALVDRGWSVIVKGRRHRPGRPGRGCTVVIREKAA